MATPEVHARSTTGTDFPPSGAVLGKTGLLRAELVRYVAETRAVNVAHERRVHPDELFVIGAFKLFKRDRLERFERQPYAVADVGPRVNTRHFHQSRPIPAGYGERFDLRCRQVADPPNRTSFTS